MKYTKTVRANKSIRPSQRSVRASAMAKRSIKAEDELDAPVVDDMPAPAADIDTPAEDVIVDEVASTLLFEAEDVAELVSEISGEPVEVTVDEDEVTFAVGDDVYTVTPEGDEEIVEESTRLRKGAHKVAAARKVARPASRRVAASRKAIRPSARRVAAARRVQR